MSNDRLSQSDNIVAPIIDCARRAPRRIAIRFSGSEITYGELVGRISATAGELRRSGLSKGDRVAILAQNDPDVLVLYLAAAYLGAAAVPIHPDYSANEINYVLRHAEPALVFCPAHLNAKLDAAMDGLVARPKRLNGLNASSQACAPAIPGESWAAGGDDLVMICYTSGSTGVPKGIAASHRNELASAAAFGAIWSIGGADTVTVALPLAFMFGLHTASYVGLAHGATLLLCPNFHPRLVLEAMEAARATTLLGVPTMYAMIVEYMKSAPRSYALSSLRLAVSSGAALPDRIKEEFRDRVGVALSSYYAMSEVRPIFAPDLHAGEGAPVGSVGKLVPGTDVRLVDGSGHDVGAGETGELLARGQSLMRGYYKDPERTAAAIRDGWFRTGDLVRRDERGYYYIVGRTSDLINSGGSKIAPVEVEDVLSKHSAVVSAAVIGIPDDVFGQVVKAFVVLRQGAPVTADDLRLYSAERLAPYKVPKRIAFVESLPIGPSGKVSKKDLPRS